MKKNRIYLVAFMFFSASCGDVKKEPEASKASEIETESKAPPVAAKKNGISEEDYKKGLALVASSDCFTCHKLSEKFVGPSYRDVSARYTAHYDTLDKLATKIIKGGVGNWGQVPMPAHPTLSKEDAIQMLKYVLAVE